MTQPRVLYLCPDDDTPSGGIQVIYRHVDVLNEAGIPAAVLHTTPGFRCTWFEHSTRIADAASISLDGAVVAIPEIYGPQIGSFFPGVRKVVFNQGAYLTFNGYSLDPADRTTPYLHPEVEATIVVSEDNERYLRHTFPGLRLLRTVNRIDSDLFRPAELRRRRIAFMPRRNAADAAQVISILKFRGVLDDVEVAPLEGLDQRQVAAALHDALIFLSLGTAEGCPMPPKEALASGCLAVGYHGLGGRDFFRRDIAYPVETGDVVAFAKQVEELLAEHPGDPVPLPAKGRAAAAAIHERYSAERERESVLAAWEQILPVTRPRPRANPEEPLASIAILTLNGLQHTKACLESIERCTPEQHELVLIDNGSTDGTRTFLREYAAARPHVRLVLNDENRGFAGGNNQALALARGRYVALLNNDTLVTPCWLRRLVDAVERTPGAGIAGPMSNYVAPPQLVEVDYGSAEELDPFAERHAAAHAGEVFRVPRVIGFCLLARREVVEAVGALDETFGAGNFEDDDWCLRAAAAGFDSVVAVEAFVHHTGSQTFIGERIDYGSAIVRNAHVFEAKWGCTVETWLERGAAAVEAERLAAHRHLPLSEPPAPPAAAGPDEAGEARVEAFLSRARDAVAARDAAAVRAAFAEPVGWDEPHRAYQAVFHLCELVLAAGAATHDAFWVDLYIAAAQGLLDVLEREPAEPVLLNVAGVLLYELTAHEGAIALFERALELDPTLPATGDNLAAARQAAVDGQRLTRPELAALGDRGIGVAARARPAEGLTLSLCMIVKDEEELLPGCLAAAKDAVDEIVVVDTGSSDRTVEIAESFGAKVVHFPWNGSFADARNVSIEHATGDWVIYLDADEHLDPEAPAEIRAVLGRTWREGFYIHETNLTGDDDAGTAVSHPALRIWRNRPEYRFEGRIHEQKTRFMPTFLPERFEITDARMLHYGYLKSRVIARGKSRRNLELLEIEAREAPSPFVSFNLGSEYQMLGDWQQACVHFDAAWDGLRAEGADWHGYGFAPLLASRAGRARREAGRVEDARALLAEAAEAMPDYTDLHFELAACAQAAGDLAEAERLLRHCLELGDAPERYPSTVGTGSHLALGLLAEVRQARGDLAEAERLYRAALERQPAFTAPVLPLAQLLVRREATLAELRAAVPLETPRVALLAATACLEAERPADAEALLRVAGANDPASRAALLQALLAQRRYEDAAEAAAAEPAGSPIAPLAAEAALVARAAADDPAGLARALAGAEAAGVSQPVRELFAAWHGMLAGEPPAEQLPADALEPALGILDDLLRSRSYRAAETLLELYPRIAVDPRVRDERLARVSRRHGLQHSHAAA